MKKPNTPPSADPMPNAKSKDQKRQLLHRKKDRIRGGARRAWLGMLAAAMACVPTLASGQMELRTVLICTVELADQPPCATAAEVEGVLFTNPDNVDGAFRAASYGQLGLQLGNGSGMDPTVELVLSESVADFISSADLKNRMHSELQALGYDTSTDSYDHILYLQPSSGLGGGAEAYAAGTQTTVYKTFGFYGAMHEMGHNLGLNHSGSDFNDDGILDSAYGDRSCTMGGAKDTFNALKKVQMGWLDAWPEAVTTLSRSGTHTLVPVNHHPDTVPGERVAIIPNLVGGDIYVSYRLTGPVPYNSLAGNDANARISVHRHPSPPNGISRILGYYDEGQVFINEGDGVRISVNNIADDLMSAEVTIDVGYDWIQGGDPTQWDDPANWRDGSIPPSDDPFAEVRFGPNATGSIAGGSATGNEKVTLSALHWETSFQWEAFGEVAQPATTGIFVNAASEFFASAVAANGATLTTHRVPWNLDSDLRLTGNGKLAIRASGADGVNGLGGFIVESGTELLFESAVPASTYDYAYSGGVSIRNNGLVRVTSDNGALGAGPVTIAEGGRLDLTSGSVANDVEFVPSSDGSAVAFLAGSAAVTFDGNFTFNCIAANPAAGSTWQIVDPALTATYGAGFSVTGFTESVGVWTGTILGGDYSFNESTGVLSCDATSRVAYVWTQAGDPTKWDDTTNWADGVVPPGNDTNTALDFGGNALGEIAGATTVGNEKVTLRSLRWSTSFQWKDFGESAQPTTTGVFVATGSADPAVAVAVGNQTLTATNVPWNLDSDLVLAGEGKLTLAASGTEGVNGPGGFIVEPGTTLAFADAGGGEDYTYTGGVTIRDGGLVDVNSVNGALGNGPVTIDQGGRLGLTSGTMDNNTSFVLGLVGTGAPTVTGASVTFSGVFTFDLAAACTDPGTRWQITDPATPPNYGGSFSVAGFSEQSGTWAGFANGALYRFDAGTGVLSCDGMVSSDPVFVVDPMVWPEAIASMAYTGETIAGSAIDPEGDTLTYSKTAGPAWLNIASDGTLTGTPANGDIGQNSFTVQANDGNGGTDTATLVINVRGGITVVNAGASQVVDDGATSATVSNWSLNGGNAVVVFFGGEEAKALSATYGGESMTVVEDTTGDLHVGAIAYIINPSAATGDIELSWLQDGGGWGPEIVFTPISLINVGSVVASKSRDTGDTLAFPYTTALDEGFVVGSAVNNNWKGGPESAPGVSGNFDTFVFRDNVSANFAATHVYGSVPTAGAYSDTLGPVRSAAAVGFEAFNTTPPTLVSSDIVDDQAGYPTAPNTVVTYTLTFNEYMDDATIDASDFSNAGTAAVIVETVTEISPWEYSVTVRPTTAGTLQLQIPAGASLEDASGMAMDTTSAILDDTTLTVDDTSAPPSWATDPVNETAATEDAAYSSSLADNASDDDLDTLTFSKLSGPAWLAVSANGTLSGTPANPDVGVNSFTVSVSDGYWAAQEATLNITVLNTNDAPVFTADALSPPDATQGDPYLGQTLAGSALDDDTGDTLTYSVVSGPAWLAVAADGALSGTPASSDIGLNSFTVQVSDGNGGADTATLNITVVNDAPVFTVDPIGLPYAIQGDPYTGQTLAGSASDANTGDTLTYSKVSGPLWLAVAADGALSGTPASSDLGQNSFTAQVSDGNGGTDTATLNILVANEGAIVVLNTGENTVVDDGATSATIADWTLNGGNAVVVFFAGERAKSLSATYGGESMVVVEDTTGGVHTGAIAYIIDPAVSTGDIALSWLQDGGKSETVHTPISLINVGSVVASGSRDTATPLTLDYTTTVDAGFVVGAAVNNRHDGGPDAAPGFSGNLDTLVFRNNVSWNCAVTLVYGDVPTAGTYTDTLGGDPIADSAAAVAFEAITLNDTTPLTYEDWRRGKFTEAELADANVSGPHANPDGDLLANLGEYGLGLDPKVFDDTAAFWSYEDVSGTMCWVFTLRKYSGRGDVNLYLKRSLTMQPESWQTIARVLDGGALEVLNGASLIEQSGSDPEILRIREPLDDESRRFYRWFIERPTP